MGGLLGGGGCAGGGSGGGGGGGGGGGSAGGSLRQQPEQSQFFSNWSWEQVTPPPKSSHSLHVLPLQSLAHECGSGGGLGGFGELGGGGGHSHASTTAGWAGGGGLLRGVAAGTAGGADGRTLLFVRVDGWLRSGMEGGGLSDAHHPGMRAHRRRARILYVEVRILYVERHTGPEFQAISNIFGDTDIWLGGTSQELTRVVPFVHAHLAAGERRGLVGWARTRAAARRCTTSRGRRRRRRRRNGDGEVAADGGAVAERARGAGDLHARCMYVHRRWGCTIASSGGRGRASSAAACPSLGGRTPTSFTTARRPRTRTAERLLAGRRRGRR